MESNSPPITVVPIGARTDPSPDRAIAVGTMPAVIATDYAALRRMGEKQLGLPVLTIPADLGYGARWVGGELPPNSTLLFKVELLEVK